MVLVWVAAEFVRCVPLTDGRGDSLGGGKVIVEAMDIVLES